jgi:hypothetical protein
MNKKQLIHSISTGMNNEMCNTHVAQTGIAAGEYQQQQLPALCFEVKVR